MTSEHKAETLKHASKKVDHVIADGADSVIGYAQDLAGQISDTVADVTEQISDGISSTSKQLEKRVKSSPKQSLCIAAALGFAAGVVFARR